MVGAVGVAMGVAAISRRRGNAYSFDDGVPVSKPSTLGAAADGTRPIRKPQWQVLPFDHIKLVEFSVRVICARAKGMAMLASSYNTSQTMRVFLTCGLYRGHYMEHMYRPSVWQ